MLKPVSTTQLAESGNERQSLETAAMPLELVLGFRVQRGRQSMHLTVGQILCVCVFTNLLNMPIGMMEVYGG